MARAQLDYERARSHALTVRATDGVTGAFADASVTLRLLDVNDCAPDLDQDLYRASVSEAAAIGDLVLRVRATDNDTGQLRDRLAIKTFLLNASFIAIELLVQCKPTICHAHVSRTLNS